MINETRCLEEWQINNLMDGRQIAIYVVRKILWNGGEVVGGVVWGGGRGGEQGRGWGRGG